MFFSNPKDVYFISNENSSYQTKYIKELASHLLIQNALITIGVDNIDSTNIKQVSDRIIGPFGTEIYAISLNIRQIKHSTTLPKNQLLYRPINPFESNIVDLKEPCSASCLPYEVDISTSSFSYKSSYYMVQFHSWVLVAA
jgi:hypothetical protein